MKKLIKLYRNVVKKRYCSASIWKQQGIHKKKPLPELTAVLKKIVFFDGFWTDYRSCGLRVLRRLASVRAIPSSSKA